MLSRKAQIHLSKFADAAKEWQVRQLCQTPQDQLVHLNRRPKPRIPEKFVLCSTFILVAKCSSFAREENTETPGAQQVYWQDGGLSKAHGCKCHVT